MSLESDYFDVAEYKFFCAVWEFIHQYREENERLRHLTRDDKIKVLRDIADEEARDKLLDAEEAAAT
jgi:hypothetical protein